MRVSRAAFVAVCTAFVLVQLVSGQAGSCDARVASAREAGDAQIRTLRESLREAEKRLEDAARAHEAEAAELRRSGGCSAALLTGAQQAAQVAQEAMKEAYDSAAPVVAAHLGPTYEAVRKSAGPVLAQAADAITENADAAAAAARRLKDTAAYQYSVVRRNLVKAAPGVHPSVTESVAELVIYYVESVFLGILALAVVFYVVPALLRGLLRVLSVVLCCGCCRGSRKQAPAQGTAAGGAIKYGMPAASGKEAYERFRAANNASSGKGGQAGQRRP